MSARTSVSSAGVVTPEIVGPVLEHLALPSRLAAARLRVGVHPHGFARLPHLRSAFSARDIFQQAQTMADVAGFYSAFGLKVGGREREQADHIAGVELEFMSFMALKLAYAIEYMGPEQVEIALDTQRTFLRDHLGRWGGSLGQRTASTAQGQPLYRAVGELLESWIGEGVQAPRHGPHRLPGRSGGPLPEQDDAVCGGRQSHSLHRVR
ncbi:MAG: molecular chaperone TorD family protein [Dehalococcoidia bacterium]